MSTIETSWIVRPNDHVVLQFKFDNFVLNTERKLIRAQQGPASITVTFQPQHIVELVNPIDTVLSRIAGLTRLTFRAPDTFVPIDYNLRKVLEACTSWNIQASSNAQPPVYIQVEPPTSTNPLEAIKERRLKAASLFGELPFDMPEEQPGAPERPKPAETQIELPYRLLISPSLFAKWIHKLEPYVSSVSGHTELWHTTLATRGTSNIVHILRALYTRDKNFDDRIKNRVLSDADAGVPFTSSLNADDRGRIVYNSSDFTVSPTPFFTNNLTLSALGGTCNIFGNWNNSALQPQLLSWKHRTTMGRDEKVETQGTKCILYPFLHEAVILQSTQRVIENGKAILKKFLYLVIIEPKRVYPIHNVTAAGFSYVINDIPKTLDRNNPFRTVEYLKLSSSGIINPLLPIPTEDGFYRLDPDEKLPAIVTDRMGNAFKTSIPIRFLLVDQKLDSDYSNTFNINIEVNERVAYADATDLQTTHFTKDMALGIVQLKSINDIGGENITYIGPALKSANILIEAVQHLTTKKEELNKLVRVVYYPSYIENGLDTTTSTNIGEVFMTLAKGENAPCIDFSQGADKSGGFVQPSQFVHGFSRKLGIVGGPQGLVDPLNDVFSTVANGNIYPTKIFSLDACKIFGTFKLTDIMGIQNINDAPKFVTRPMNIIERFVHDINTIKSSLANIPIDTQLLETKIDNVIMDIARFDIRSLENNIPGLASEIRSLIQSLTNLLSNSQVDGHVTLIIRRLQNILILVNTAQTIFDAVKQLERGIELAKDLHVHLDWRPKVTITDDFVRNLFYPQNEYCLLLSVDVRAKPQGNKPAGTEVFCSLENFDLTLVKLDSMRSIDEVPIRLAFKHIQFTLNSNKKADLSVVFKDEGIHFGGVLSFIEKLRSIIPLDGFSDPPSLDITQNGIRAGFSASLPSVAVGMFSLENICLSAELNIPIVGSTPLNFVFSFCSIDQPFLLTVSMLGGGGYFRIVVTPKGIDSLEAGLEFGAALSINLGVASGSVSVMAGVYFRIDTSGITLGGYLRIRGEVDVLGLISASIEMYMKLTYKFENKKVTGRAEIIVEVDIMFFSTSVKLECERRFAGSNGDPTFEEVMAPEGSYKPWEEYCLAFA